jgi:hypothetical protein
MKYIIFVSINDLFSQQSVCIVHMMWSTASPYSLPPRPIPSLLARTPGAKSLPDHPINTNVNARFAGLLCLFLPFLPHFFLLLFMVLAQPGMLLATPLKLCY